MPFVSCSRAADGSPGSTAQCRPHPAAHPAAQGSGGLRVETCPEPARPAPVAQPEEEVHTAMSGPTDAPPRKVVIGTMMYAMWEEYPGLESRLDTLVGFIDRMAADARSRCEVGLDLAVLPESAVTGETGDAPESASSPLDGKVLDAMGAAARVHHTYIIVPMTLAEDPERGVYTNSNVLLDRGERRGKLPEGAPRRRSAGRDARGRPHAGQVLPGLPV